MRPFQANLDNPLNNRRGSERRLESIGSKSAEFVAGSDSIVTLTQNDSIVAYASLRGRRLQKPEVGHVGG